MHRKRPVKKYLKEKYTDQVRQVYNSLFFFLKGFNALMIASLPLLNEITAWLYLIGRRSRMLCCVTNFVFNDV